MDNSNLDMSLEDDISIKEESIGESRNTPSAYDIHYKDSHSNSKETSRKNINNKKTTKKKPRRSRMIINEDFDSVPEYKREIYDVDTKYIKSLENGVIFNNFITSSRFQLSKHFLKRKIKFNFEREEKFPSFFNVSFLPKSEMFPLPPTPQQRSNINMNMQMTKQGPNTQFQQKPTSYANNTISVINAQSNNSNINNPYPGMGGNNININPNLSNAISVSVGANMSNNNNNKGLFNVNPNKVLSNQPPQSSSMTTLSVVNQINQDQKIIIPLNSQTLQDPLMSASKSNNINDNTLHHSQDNNKIIIPNTPIMPNANDIKKPITTINQGRPHNKEDENRLLQVIMEKYKNNPEGLRREYGDEKFSKIERILVRRGIITLPLNSNSHQPKSIQSNTISINLSQINNSTNIIQQQNAQK